MELGIWLVLAVWIPVILLWIFGGLFLKKISGGQRGYGFLFKQTWKGVFAWAIPPWKRALKVLVVVVLIAAGLAVIGAAPRWWTYEVTTGYSYRLEKHIEYQPIMDYYCKLITTPMGSSQVCDYVTRWVKAYKYSLVETPVTTHFQTWYLEMGHVLIGLALIIAGLIVAAYSLVKANNELYGVAASKKRGKRRRK